LCKTQKRLVKEMLYGIQASKDVKLSNISRTLQEPIPLIKTEDRLSRSLSMNDLTGEINEQLMRLGTGKIDEDMVIAIDPGDLMKPYAKAMENLCGIYDGSKHQGANGYHLCQVTAANLEHNKIVPLYCEAYSSIPEDYPGSSEKLMEIITKVKAHIGQKGTWAIGVPLKLKVMVQKIFFLSKRIFGVPTFFNYAMADGIFELLKHSRAGPNQFKSRIGHNYDTFQLSLFPD
jgi:hypothetical protein